MAKSLPAQEMSAISFRCPLFDKRGSIVSAARQEYTQAAYYFLSLKDVLRYENI